MTRLPSGDRKVRTDIDVVNQKEVAFEDPRDTGNDTVLNYEVHARILRKLDWHLLPLVSLLYFLSFFLRQLLANARIAGMATDLNLVGLRYNTAAAVFFVTYCLGQPPSNVILKLFRPSRWIPLIMVVWGLVMTLMCLVKTYPQLIVARVFLGLAESGLFPGVIFYISLWYPRAEQAKRFALFTSASTVAGAFGGILAYCIMKMEGIGGLHGWQWIFCLEGIVTVLTALVAPCFMYDTPETASFLTETERRYIVELMKADSQGLATHYNFMFVLQALKDYKTYLQFGIYIGSVIPSYALALFAPTIINELGFSAANAELLTVPPSVAGSICVIIAGIYSDRHRIRGPYIIGAGIVGLVGCIILYTQTRPGVALFGVVFASMGIYPCMPITLAWVSSNAGGDMKRGVAIAVVNGLANLGGICSSFMFFDPPRFHVGLGIGMGLLCSSMLLSSFAMWNYNRLNEQKKKLCSERGITKDQEDEFGDLGDDSPLFRYTL
ncbi:major facilitator superfamily domain-containing protein [Boletus coccyginus]|nr:major facilitator superfamily domain-containing protein [Boletus coccyginus]